MRKEEKVAAWVGEERSALGPAEVKALLLLTPSIRRRASAFLSQPVAPPVSGRRQEAASSHVNKHLDPHPLSRRVTLVEQKQIDFKVVHSTLEWEIVNLFFSFFFFKLSNHVHG